jgi:hypothetical protein
MHWKFERMFTIKVMHEGLPTQPKDEATTVPAFTLKPTTASLQRMKKLNWVARPIWNGLVVFAERNVRTDGTPMPPHKPSADEHLAFTIELNTPGLLKKTKPYMKIAVPGPVPNDQLPNFSGRGRLLYFNNLNAVPLSTDTFRITQEDFVAEPEFASRAPTSFDFTAAQVGVATVEAKALLPNPPPVQSFAFKPAASKTQVELANNAYEMVQKPSAPEKREIMYLTNETLPEKTLGIVSIFDIASAPIDQNKTFQLAFAKI